MRGASDEFSGHCLALTLLGSFLTDAYNGDIRCSEEVSKRLAQDIRQGAHARKVMESYQDWFGKGPELSVLRMLGLFDRPAEANAIGILLKPPPISGLTESFINISPTKWRTILARLGRARLLTGEDPLNPGYLDTHLLIREYRLATQQGQVLPFLWLVQSRFKSNRFHRSQVGLNFQTMARSWRLVRAAG